MRKKISKIKITKNIAEQFELPVVGLMRLPPNWKVLEKNGYFYFYNENNELELQNVNDSDTVRKFCWSIYNRITDK